MAVWRGYCGTDGKPAGNREDKHDPNQPEKPIYSTRKVIYSNATQLFSEAFRMYFQFRKTITVKISILLAILVLGTPVVKAELSVECGYEKKNIKTHAITVKLPFSKVVSRRKPEYLLGFDINFITIQLDYFDNKRNKVERGVIDLLSHMKGVPYRYPAGGVSNRFDWKESVKLVEKRDSQRLVNWLEPFPVLFGLPEYFSFLDAVAGKPLYVVNLVGSDNEIPNKMDDESGLISSIRSLAKYLKKAEPEYIDEIVFELGNELDRGKYQWTEEQYIKRARLAADILKEEIPTVKLLIPLREWDWRYKGNKRSRGVQRSESMIRKIMKKFPDAYGVSFHLYYHPDYKKYPYLGMTNRLYKMGEALTIAKKLSKNNNLKIWITEHAISRLDKKESRTIGSVDPLTQSALMTANFLTKIAPNLEIESAFFHVLNGRNINNTRWKVFDRNNSSGEIEGKPVFQVMSMFKNAITREILVPKVEYQFSSSIDKSNTGVISFIHRKEKSVATWVVNGSNRALNITVSKSGVYDGLTKVGIEAYCLEKQKMIKESWNYSSGITSGTGKENIVDNGFVSVSIPPYTVATITVMDPRLILH